MAQLDRFHGHDDDANRGLHHALRRQSRPGRRQLPLGGPVVAKY